jgi:thiosulfate dehydrogenase [quinone] large subunit
MRSKRIPSPPRVESHFVESWHRQPSVSAWRARTLACLRVAFGGIWAVAAWLKWQPAFQHSFVAQINKAKDGQAPAIQAWISWWSALISLNPLLFARIEASTETALALLLILGLFSNLSYAVGALLALGIWAVPEGVGGPYVPGQTTDVGTTLPYALIFGMLFVTAAGQYYAVDQWLTPRLGPLGIIASRSSGNDDFAHEREFAF